MHINKIDEIIDKILDDFYINVIKKNVIINKILNETNFVKYQLNINDIFREYFTGINLTELNDEIKNSDVYNTIVDLFKKFCMIYLFLTVGYMFKDNDSVFINNIIEFSKNQSAFSFKINNFFNSESNADLIKYYTILKQMNILFNADVKQKELLLKKVEYTNTIQLINNIGEDVIKELLAIKDASIKRHSVIKLIVIFDIYKVHDKKNIYKLIELTENTNEEFMFIDIVIPVKESIDFSVIESILTKNELNKGFAYVIWDYLNESADNLFYQDEGMEDKILKLFESKIILPISDDILLYNKMAENYEKVDYQSDKRKEDTKVKYIINKVDSAINLVRSEDLKDVKDQNSLSNLSNLSIEAKKQFYVPLMNRRAIIVNQIENIKIINKILNQGNITSENLELLRDLENYVIYPYVNLKESENSIMLHFRKNNNVVRSVSFEKKGDFKQRKKDRLQMRTTIKDGLLNIIGVFIPSNTKAINCIKSHKTKNIIKYLDSKNGYDAAVDIIRKNVINGEKIKSSYYWFFNPDIDIITQDTYVHLENISKVEQNKKILVKLYDELHNQIYQRIIDNIDDIIKSNVPITIQMVEDIINYYEVLLKITKNKEYLDKLETIIYDKYIQRGLIKYDKNDDLVYGITGEVIPLPEYKEEKSEKTKSEKTKRVKINTNKYSINKESGIEEKIEGVCQHNISWDNLNQVRKEDKKLFLDKLNKFVTDYVNINFENEFVCKSCGFYLNIKKYISDGKFDDNTKTFVVYGSPIDEPLEEISGYEKYKGAIRNIDRYIEKIALITNIPYFIGFNYTIRSRRKLLVKDVIDVLIENNFQLKKHIKQYHELASKNYGIKKDLSSLFVFELENNLFIYSSKDKDFYKPIKQNNVLAYVIFLIMLELNDTQVGFIDNKYNTKGFCNFTIFDKVYTNIFSGLKFKKNNKGDTVNVVDYPIFCYILYMIACYATKYKLWYHDIKDNMKDGKDEKTIRQKLAPLIQKIIITTVIDVINSILEYGFLSLSVPKANVNVKSRRHIYEVLIAKFYNKLETTFSNQKLYDSFKDEGRTSIGADKKSFIITKPEAYKLSGTYKTIYDLPINWRKITPTRLFLPIFIHKIDKYYDINNITNCESGNFHEWAFSNKTLECKICKKKSIELKYDKSLTDSIKTKNNIIRLDNLAKTYCKVDGEPHDFIDDDKNNKICKKCKLSDTHKYTDKELLELDKQFNNKLVNKANNSIIKSKQINDKIKDENDYINKLKIKIEDEYNEVVKKQNNLDEFINSFITYFNVLGNINKLKYNTYVFDHDHLGNKLDKEVVIIDSDNKINYKSNHPFFKTDVLYYTSYKAGKIDVFYDIKTNILLGYKEENKNFILNKLQNKRIRIEYSLFNKIKLLGYDRSNYNIEIKELNDKSNIKTIENDKINQIKNIIRNRNSNLKAFIYKFQRFINRLSNKYTTPIPKRETKYVNDEENYYVNKFENIINNYKKKINNIKLSSESGNHTIFKHWNGIDNITTEKLNELNYNIDNNIIKSSDINIIDKSGNLLLFYIVNELTKLIKYNSKNQSVLCNILSDFIDSYYFVYYEEEHEHNLDYKRFSYIINSQTYVNEVMERIGETEGIYEEYIDPNKVITEEEQDQIDDDNEAQEALDVENDEIDYYSLYDYNLGLEPTETYIKSIQNYSFQDYIYNKL